MRFLTERKGKALALTETKMEQEANNYLNSMCDVLEEERNELKHNGLAFLSAEEKQLYKADPE